jgi:hypothetical protein
MPATLWRSSPRSSVISSGTGTFKMRAIDKIVFGDNQFFGINHMSQEKAQRLAEKFFDIDNIYRVYDMAFAAGLRAVMLNSNDRAREICEHFRKNGSKYPDLNWYPSIPYPHKYANMISEKGILPTIKDVLLADNSALGILGLISKGGGAVLRKDAIKMMQMLIDVEMKMFMGLNIQCIFLQNILTDLLLGFEIKEVFLEYVEYIRTKYKVAPGLITQNMPKLKAKLEEWGIEGVVICTSFNKIGYLMSPSLEAYVRAAAGNDPEKYPLMAMSTLASGAIPAPEAYDFINKQKIQSVVFGASSKGHIEETVRSIHIG